MLTMKPGLATLLHIVIARFSEHGLIQNHVHMVAPCGFDLSGWSNRAIRLQYFRFGITLKQFTRIGPELIERRLHTLLAFHRAITQPDHKIRAPLQMVGDFFRCLLGYFRNFRVG